MTRSKVTELPAVRYVGAVPDAWLADTPPPAGLHPSCNQGVTPVLCSKQLESLLRRWMGALDMCNADKADAREWQAQRIQEASKAAKPPGTSPQR